MIDIADAAGTQHPYVQMQLARGAIRYRLGDSVAALPYLENAVHITESWRDSWDEFFGTEAAFFLALAQHQAGRHAQAQASLQLARSRLNELNEAVDKPYPDMVWKLAQICRETETELGPEARTSSPEN